MKKARFLWLLALLSAPVLAHNKVVVIPMAGDDVEVGIHLDRTQIVGGSGTAQDNGTALIQALNFVKSQNPTADDPWLIKLEPGIYSLLFDDLTLTGHIHLKGAGYNVTEISSVGNTLGGASPTVVVSGDTSIMDVQISHNAFGGSAVLLAGPAKLTVQNSYLRKVSGSVVNGAALLIDQGAKVDVSNSIISAEGPDVEAVFIESSELELNHSHVSSNGGAAIRSCCQEQGETATVNIFSSRVQGGADPAFMSATTGTVLSADHSFFNGDFSATILSHGAKFIRHSTIIGSVIGTGSEICVATAGLSTFLATGCP